MKKSLKITAALATAALFAASCGVVSFTGRKQILLYSDSEIAALSDESYTEFMSTAKASSNATATQTLQEVGKKMTAALESYLEKNGQRIKLTQVEYSIMRVFMENPGKALSREEILDRVWGRDYFGELKIVDVNIRRLRLKIEDNVQNPVYITTVWGYGYKWGF